VARQPKPKAEHSDAHERALPERRLFIAVPVPDAVRLFVADLVARVRGPDVDPREPGARRAPRGPRWVSLEALHLTIRFLGSMPEDRLADLRRAVSMAAGGQGPFRVAIGGGGAFPSLDRPRAIWLGVADPDGGLAGLAESVRGALEEAGWAQEDWHLTPHLTLARTDGVRDGAVVARRLVDTAEGLEAWFEIDRLVLYQSHTGRGRARYEPLHEAPLRH
jgi:2'-5' RNA ligase